MPASTNTVAIYFDIIRAIGTGSKREIGPKLRTLQNVTAATVVEVVLAAGATNVSVPFGAIATAQAIVIVTPLPITVKINGAAGRLCGSVWILADTDVTSLTFDNSSNPAAPVTVEVWLVTTS